MDAFLAPFRRMRLSCGFEKSWKMSQGRLITGRCLVSLHRDDLAAIDADFERALQALLRECQFPAGWSGWMSRHSHDAGFIHFGYESGEEDVTHKVYVEYAGTSQNTSPAQGDLASGVLVYRSLKWRLKTREAPGETHYYLRPDHGRPLGARIADYAESNAGLRMAVTVVQHILLQALEKAPARDFMLMDVVDANSSRHSFDLRLYSARLGLRDIEPGLRDFGTLFDIGAPLAALLDREGSPVLGHIAAGSGRNGEVFATVYHGARAL